MSTVAGLPRSSCVRTHLRPSHSYIWFKLDYVALPHPCSALSGWRSSRSRDTQCRDLYIAHTDTKRRADILHTDDRSLLLDNSLL